MSDETDTTSEVARVLAAHQVVKQTGQWRGVATGQIRLVCRCGWEIGWPYIFDRTKELHAEHVAYWLGKAGLLRPQIATQEPAGATQGGFGDSRASGGLGGRLRALGTGQTRTLRKVLRAMADEADRLENEADMQRHSARSWRVQAEQAQGELRVIEGMSAR